MKKKKFEKLGKFYISCGSLFAFSFSLQLPSKINYRQIHIVSTAPTCAFKFIRQLLLQKIYKKSNYLQTIGENNFSSFKIRPKISSFPYATATAIVLLFASPRPNAQISRCISIAVRIKPTTAVGCSPSVRSPRASPGADRVSKASEYICVIITAHSTRAIMRVIVWLTKRSGQDYGCTLLFDRRTRYHGHCETISHAAIFRPSNCAKRMWTTRQTNGEYEGERGRGKGVYARREIPIAIIISRARASLVNGRRATASCRSADRAKRVSNDYSFFTFLFFFPPETRRNLSRYTLHARFSRDRHVARSSLIMNGLFIVADAYLACPTHFLRFHRLCAHTPAVPRDGFTMKKSVLCGL